MQDKQNGKLNNSGPTSLADVSVADAIRAAMQVRSPPDTAEKKAKAAKKRKKNAVAKGMAGSCLRRGAVC